VSVPVAGSVEIAPDPAALARMAADWLVGRMMAARGDFRLSLSGGSTPRALYALLASDEFRPSVPWDKLALFWGDERFVPPDDKESNYRMARETLLARAPMAADRIHPIPTDGTPDEAALRYESLLKQIYGADRLDPGRPLFDVILLGLGADGHTGSLLPGQPVLQERTRWVAAVAQGRPEARITLTYPAIESSGVMAFLVAGADKAPAVKAARAGDRAMPAARLRPQGEAIWFLDRAAAGAA